MVRKIKVGRIQINLSNKWIYTLIAIGIVLIVAVGIYAWANPTTGVGHELNEINFPSCSDGQVLGISGSSWSCVDIPSGGITTETDPTVKSWAKTDNPSIPGTASANVLKVRGGTVPMGNGCSSSQWGEIRLCTGTFMGVTFNLVCVCSKMGALGWKWWSIINQ